MMMKEVKMRVKKTKRMGSDHKHSHLMRVILKLPQKTKKQIGLPMNKWKINKWKNLKNKTNNKTKIKNKPKNKSKRTVNLRMKMVWRPHLQFHLLIQ